MSKRMHRCTPQGTCYASPKMFVGNSQVGQQSKVLGVKARNPTTTTISSQNKRQQKFLVQKAQTDKVRRETGREREREREREKHKDIDR